MHMSLDCDLLLRNPAARIARSRPWRTGPVSEYGDDKFIPLASVSLYALTTDTDNAGDLIKEIENTVPQRKVFLNLKDIKYEYVDGNRIIHLRMSHKGRKLTTFSAPATGLSAKEQEVLADVVKVTASVPRNFDGTPLLSVEASLAIDGNTEGDHFKMCATIRWRNSSLCPAKLSLVPAISLYKYLPPRYEIPSRGDSWSPRDFYDNVHIPEKTEERSAIIKNHLIVCELFPFQRRAVRWLLEREGKALLEDGRLIDKKENPLEIPLSFERTVFADGRPGFVSHMLGVATTDIETYRRAYPEIKGGILAEEMGLGKTVEMIALMCLNQRKQDLDGVVHGGLRTSGATLIITPPSILEQWKQEIETHAPALSVIHYAGIKHYKDKYVERGLMDDLAGHDIVLCTYNTLSNEIHYTDNQPERGLRHQKRFVPRKSPLVQICWWRVCLDEAQMVESGVSAAAQVARLIPRINAWAVSGTPLRRDAKDLFGLLLFLRYEPWCLSQQIWERLLSYFKPCFRQVISRIAIRHSKDGVREDLRLPPQTRNVITMPFNAIEETHYNQLFQEACDDIQTDLNGAPLTEDWDPNSSAVIEKMRIWLTRLRQTCLHPEVGGRNRRALGRSEGPLRTVEEVLEAMIDQNESILRNEQRNMLLMTIRKGQIYENARMTQEAFEQYTKAYEAAMTMVQELRTSLAAEQTKEDAARDARRKQADGDDDDSEASPRIGAWRLRLRLALEVEHICVFFRANCFYQMKTKEGVEEGSDEFQKFEGQEENAYEDAKKIRSELLVEALSKVDRLMTQIRKKAEDKTLTPLPDLAFEAPSDFIEHRKIYDKLGNLVKAIHQQIAQFADWREKMVEFLSSNLIDEDEGAELTGAEYEASTKHQDEMYAYMEAIRALYADISESLHGQENTLILHEMKLARLAARRREGPAPDIFLQVLDVRDKWKPGKELGSLRGITAELRNLAASLQWQEGSGSSLAAVELQIVNTVLQQTQRMANDLSKATVALEREVELFRDTMNQRLEYYRALQKISDTVAPWEEEKVGQPFDQATYNRTEREEKSRESKVSAASSKQRYLRHLKMESSLEGSQRMCVICQCEFETGTLTLCAHVFCKDCIQLWWSVHRTCPMCKKHLHWPRDFHQISYKPKELVVTEEQPTSDLDLNPGPSSTSWATSTDLTSSQSIYTTINTQVLNQIKNINLPSSSSFGTKIDTLLRHILYLRSADPGSKSVIFSQFREFLEVLTRAFKIHRITYSSIDSGTSSSRRDGGTASGLERFKHDPSIECFLLHAKAQSTGINLVNASHVFLCEPLINTALELQAIARVHRIGQKRPTTVIMYLVDGTVEQSIYDISLERRLQHVRSRGKLDQSRHQGLQNRNREEARSNGDSGTATPNIEFAIDKANSLEMQEANLSRLLASGRNGGEVVGMQDLWGCLFGGRAQAQVQNVGGVNGGESSGDSVAALQREMDRFFRGEAAEARRDER